MADPLRTTLSRLRIDRYVAILCAIWTGLAGLSLFRSLSEADEHVLGQALALARVNLDKDIAFRRWASDHGGVYVPADARTPPNPYLSHVPERDIVTPSGRRLTLMNPAYIIRQLHEAGQDRFGSQGHLTSLKPINPANAPDPWETEALRAFERGKAEVSSLDARGGKTFLRLMLPFVTEKGCLKCHAAQGYKEGDVRGGISVSVPFDPFLASAREERLSILAGHAVLWVIGLGGIVYGGRRIANYNRERERFIERLQQSEQALRASEEELKEAQRVAGIGNWVLDCGTGEVGWSGELYRIFGRDPALPPPNYEEHSKILTPASLEALNAAVAKTLEGGDPYDIELEILRPDGSTGWINARGEARRDENGGIFGIRGTALDITERKRAEERIEKGLRLQTALRKIDERILYGSGFAEALDIACDAILDLGYGMCWVGLAEPGFTIRPVAIRGVAGDLFGGLELRWDETPPGNVPAGIAIRTGRTYVCADIPASSLHPPWREAAQRAGYRSSVTIPLRHDEGAIGCIAIMRESAGGFSADEVRIAEAFAQQCTIALISARRIEELRATSRRLALHVQRMPLGYIEHDADLRVTAWNPAAERILGWTANEAIGKHPFDLFVPPQMQERVRTSCAKLRDGDESWSDTVGTAVRKDGKPVTCEWFITPLRDAAGTTVGFHTLVHDISERARLEAQVQAAQRHESVGMLAGGIAHDFNNALTGIVGFGELLRAKLAGDEEGLHDLDEILRCAERASTLTRQLLTYARRRVIEPVNLSLNSVVSDLAKLIGKGAGERIEVSIALAGDLPAIRADRGQIEQVLMNLFLNARDAMPDGGKLRIETQSVFLSEDYVRYNPTMRSGRFALLVVSDTGVGMDEQTQKRAFEPFFTTKTPDKGTGLGLAMVYGIVKQHNGFVYLYSEPGKGTTFKVYFPAVEGAPDAVRTVDRDEGVSGGKETLLLAEDEEVIRGLAERTLKTLGYRVLAACNGKEAVEIARENEDIALAILDVVMPKMGGREALEEIRRTRPDLKALFMSGYAGNTIDGLLVSGAGTSFLEKPFGPTVLARKVREMLDTPG